MILPTWFNYTFIFISLISSLVYGLKAFDIFGPRLTEENKWTAWHLHQIWFNFTGSLLGWIALWFVIRKTWNCIELSCPAQLDWSDATIIAIAFVGITGYLPFTLFSLLQSIKELASRALGLESKN